MVSMMRAHREELDAALQRDLAILSSLAHLGWLTTDHLHALCFPGMMLSTVRTTLRYLREAGWVHSTRWRMKAWDGCQLWAITAKGHAMVERYLPTVVPYRPLDLARPTTALEHAEYRVQFAVRAFAIQLILEARQTTRLAQLTLELPQRGPSRLGGLHDTLPPDALLSIAWHPAAVQPATWLPWLNREMDAQQTIHYPVYVDRAVNMDYLSHMMDAWKTLAASQLVVPTLILQHEEQLTIARCVLQACSYPQSVRLSTWQRLATGVMGNTWLDERGRVCSLQLYA